MTPTGNIRTLCATAILAAALAGCGGSPTKESTGQVVDDSMITTKVKTAMVGDKNVSATAISVETFKGRVLLSGFAKSDTERQRAETIARGVAGVSSVDNKIELR